MSESQSSLPEGELEQERINEFWESLRATTHEVQEDELAERLRTNPTPTDEELAIGAFAEQIEPQARSAVFTFYRKGYSTNSSGYYGEHSEFQQIDGWFVVDEQTQARLEADGYQVETQVFDENHLAFKRNGWPGSTEIRFYPSKPDLNNESIIPVLTELEDRWNRMAEILPNKGKPASPAPMDGSVKFREHFGKK